MDLTPFCGDATRNLHRPFSKGEWTYATNGHILVRIPRADVPEVEKAPRVEHLIPDLSACRWRLIGQNALPDVATKCPDCDGRGKLHACPDCDCECDECDGRGLTNADVSCSIGSTPVAVRYAKMIQALPNAQVSTDIPQRVFFRFDGGLGVLMPLIREYDTHLAVVL